MKFAHLADCHIGSWRDPKLRDISTTAFLLAMDKCMAESVDFVLIAGDLFNTSFPRLDNLKVVVSKLSELRRKNIPLYIIPGSHDYSPSGRTMLDVLEQAGLFVNVFKGTISDNILSLKFTEDPKTNAKITGILGKRGALEKTYYEHLDTKALEQEPGFKIFMFHSGLHEFKQPGEEHIDMQPLSLLPQNFDYYAGGHVHTVFSKDHPGYGMITYPGPLFPNSFSELEKLGRGGFYIVQDNQPQWHPVQVYNVASLVLDCTHKHPEQVTQELQNHIQKQEFNNTIVLLRLFGALESGKPSDIDFKELFDLLYAKSAYFVMKNTSQLSSKEFKEIKIHASSVQEVEQRVIAEHADQLQHKELVQQDVVQQLMNALSVEKQEGETKSDFSHRIKQGVEKVLNISL